MQVRSTHSKGTTENLNTKAHDLGGKNVLISRTFYYFGSRALDLPEPLEGLRVGRAHKSRFPANVISVFVDFITRQTAGVNAPPTNWPAGDDSWNTAVP